MELWNLVVFTWSVVMWPTGWAFPFGAIMSIAYLYIFYRLYRRFVPARIQSWLYRRITPYVGTAVTEVRGVLGSMISGQPTTGEKGTTIIHVHRTWKGALGWMLFGALCILSWQYAAWPYIRASLPF